MSAEILVVIPTYDERDSLPPLLDRLHRAVPGADVLIVDDSSPDGTGEWAARFAVEHPWLSLLPRPAKSGLASAYIDGFRWGIERGYRVLAQMDADGSHRPEELGRLLYRLDALDHPAGVIGARWVPGGAVEQWTVGRKLLSMGGNVYIRAMLGMRLSDVTAGFRAYSAAAVEESGILDVLECAGYGYQAEMTYRLVRAGFDMAEVPTNFDDRTAGRSKMSASIALEQLCQVTRWGWLRLLGRGPLS